MLVLRCVLLLLLGAQVSKAIQTSSSPTVPSDQARSEKYALSGTVVDAVTGEPIRKALVQLHGHNNTQCSAMATGVFSSVVYPLV